MSVLGAYRAVPEPQDGVCPHCSYENGPTLGSFRCPSCGHLVRGDTIEKVVSTWSWRRRGMVVLGGVGFGLAVALLSILIGSSVGNGMAGG